MSRAVVWTVAVGVLFGAAGCEKKSNPVNPEVSSPPPTPNSPVSALRLLEWSYSYLSMDEYRRVFSDDYRFLFSPLDSSGNAYRTIPWTREDELISATHLFVGGAPPLPPASNISLTLDRNFNLSADTRPGKNPRWHKSITTQAVLNVRLRDGHAFDATGSEKFFLVRGDSALIPAELNAVPDSARWYVDRWEELSLSSPAMWRPESPARRASPSRAQPTRHYTWGELKVKYR